MNANRPAFELREVDRDNASLHLHGDWVQGQPIPDFTLLRSMLLHSAPQTVRLDCSKLQQWDSSLMAFLLQCHQYCEETGIRFVYDELPEAAERLLIVATTVPAHQRPQARQRRWTDQLKLAALLRHMGRDLRESLAFIGELTIALLRVISGKANTRFRDFRQFCYQAGPDAFAIISLTSVLVGMILAYLGAVQLQQFGAEISLRDHLIATKPEAVHALLRYVRSRPG